MKRKPEAIWFSGASVVGVVRVCNEYGEVEYFIGSPPYDHSLSPNTEAYDIKWISEWGTRLPKSAGDAIFEGT